MGRPRLQSVVRANGPEQGRRPTPQDRNRCGASVEWTRFPTPRTWPDSLGPGSGPAPLPQHGFPPLDDARSPWSGECGQHFEIMEQDAYFH